MRGMLARNPAPRFKSMPISQMDKLPLLSRHSAKMIGLCRNGYLRQTQIFELYDRSTEEVCVCAAAHNLYGPLSARYHAINYAEQRHWLFRYFARILLLSMEGFVVCV